MAETSDLSLGRKFWSSGINGAVHIKLFVTDILFVEIFTKIPTHGSLRTGIHCLLHGSTRLVVVVVVVAVDAEHYYIIRVGNVLFRIFENYNSGTT